MRPQQLDDEGDAHRGLRDRRPRSRARDAPVEDVDEDDLEDEIQQVREDDDLERPAEVRDAAEVALARESDERGGQSDRRDPEVRERVVARLAVAAEAREQRLGDDLAGHEQDEPDAERGPQRLRRDAGRFVAAAGSRRARDDCRRPVSEKVENVKAPASTVPARPSAAICGRPR